MSPQDRELMQKALEAVEDLYSGFTYIRSSYGDLYGVGWDRAELKGEAAMDALRARLAEPDDEPVAFEVTNNGARYGLSSSLQLARDLVFNGERKCHEHRIPHSFKINPLYTRPAARKVQPMTREQVAEIWIEHGCDGEDAEGFARAVERAHGITGDSHE